MSLFILRERRRAWSELAAQACLAFDPGSFWGHSMSVTGVLRGRNLNWRFSRKASAARSALADSVERME